MTNCDPEVIDLTDSFVLADHCALSDAVINIDSDSSFVDDIRQAVSSPSIIRGNLLNHSNLKPKNKTKKLKWIVAEQHAKVVSSPKNNTCLGDCPICWDKLGKNPLASTKCGHVYCIKCLETYLKINKACPTCRKVLKGNNAYHPLYI